jgi:hypothetical protein
VILLGLVTVDSGLESTLVPGILSIWKIFLPLPIFVLCCCCASFLIFFSSFIPSFSFSIGVVFSTHEIRHYYPIFYFISPSLFFRIGGGDDTSPDGLKNSAQANKAGSGMSFAA